MSQQQRQQLSGALEAIGCPKGDVQNNPLDWDSIKSLLEHFTTMDAERLEEAQRRYQAFIEQPLRTRQRRNLQHLLDLLRNTGDGAQMDVEAPELSLTPAP